ncbi:protein BREAST CANCER SUSCEPTIBILITY 2 homolog B-like isoform X2 [Daucus carota subsp. sativus]|uniref:protein BREAST CANCER SUSCEPTIBILITY 2 homolog B-like isoform X2 n=1 Tax=Daucus carota subsp. sativus TaxID=79200 RepID=UPI0007EEFAF3|nr:PREDICTED: protein BREAST CANCER SUSCEPTIBILITY 2 homolog B-like isoform X1 [Daucus carota subsp. sativus]
MSTWQLHSDAENNLRWSRLPDDPQTEVQTAAPTQLRRRLPSISDLALKGYSKLKESNNNNDSVNESGYQMFRTGSGKPLVANQSSLSKASAMLSEVVFDQGYPELNQSNANSVNELGYQMFQTGSGNPVAVNQSSLLKASAMLGDIISDQGHSMINESNANSLNDSGYQMFRTGSGKPVAVNQSSLSKASAMLSDVVSDQGYSKISGSNANSVNESGYQMFRTGSGKPVVVNQSSLLKASAMMSDAVSDQGFTKLTGNVGRPLRSPSTFRNGFKNSLALKRSPLSKASSILTNEAEPTVVTGSGVTVDTGQVKAIDSACNFGNSMFQTGSGKTVTISTSGLARAQKLLCLKDNHTHQGFEGMMQQLHAIPSNQQSLHHLGLEMGVADKQSKDSISSLRSPLKVRSETSGSELLEVTPDSVHSISRPSSIKFHTAGGRSISVSSNALQRARSLLGDPELGSFMNEGDAGEPVFSIFKDRKSNMNLKKSYCSDTCVSDQHSVTRKRVAKNFISPLRPTSSQKQSLVNVGSGKNLIRNFDAEAHESTTCNDVKGCQKYPKNNDPYSSDNTTREDNIAGSGFQKDPHKKQRGWPLVDISNTTDMGDRSNKQAVAVKRVVDRRSSGSFKKPRVSKFITPLNNEIPYTENGSLAIDPEESSYKNKFPGRYPFQATRKYVKEYFGAPPSVNTTLEHLPECIRTMNPDRAEKHCFPSECGSDSVGKEAFSAMLLQSGASMKYISDTWVTNHYKWIVWKLACYERFYSERYLTVSNVMEELKYRYDREVNHGHRSAIKRILEGDAPPYSVLVLCISSIQRNTEAIIKNISNSHGVDKSKVANVELTDGWYAVNAVLDAPLSKKLDSGKLFVGQKLKISGAGLSGWAGPVSPLEVPSTVSLVLHINGTYRSHWAERLGFCKSGCAPLAFDCIKSGGGVIPSTFVGIQRIYPVLYRERLSDGEYTVRSERMEAKMQQLYNQRRSEVAEEVISELQRADADILINSDGSEEAAKIFKILETSAEPEILMAGMSSKQLKSLSIYQAKLEETRQSNIHQSIEKAFENSGLSGRDVTPFMRLSVVGLTTKIGQEKCYPRKGLITIWNPTEEQKLELVEGQAYAVSGLVAFNSGSDTLYLQTRGPTTKWRHLSSSALEQYQPFYKPRKPVSLYNLDEVPLSSEFDIAGFVIFVGEVHATANQRKQWVFVTDCSVHGSHTNRPSDDLLAISFCAPTSGHDLYLPISHNLVGSTVGFCNIIKKEKDQMNHIWVAETTENSDYSLTYEHRQYIHLKGAAIASQKWAEVSSLTVEKLKQKVISIV